MLLLRGSSSGLGDAGQPARLDWGPDCDGGGPCLRPRERAVAGRSVIEFRGRCFAMCAEPLLGKVLVSDPRVAGRQLRHLGCAGLARSGADSGLRSAAVRCRVAADDGRCDDDGGGSHDQTMTASGRRTQRQPALRSDCQRRREDTEKGLRVGLVYELAGRRSVPVQNAARSRDSFRPTAEASLVGRRE